MPCGRLTYQNSLSSQVDAVPVHMGGGMWGVISAGLFSRQDLLARAYGIEDHEGLCKFFLAGKLTSNCFH
jgi:ammonia channel protein AmtB